MAYSVLSSLTLPSPHQEQSDISLHCYSSEPLRNVHAYVLHMVFMFEHFAAAASSSLQALTFPPPHTSFFIRFICRGGKWTVYLSNWIFLYSIKKLLVHSDTTSMNRTSKFIWTWTQWADFSNPALKFHKCETQRKSDASQDAFVFPQIICQQI